MGLGSVYHETMKYVQNSKREKQDMTTQYISHGVSCAGSEVRRALYEAKIGKRTVIMDLGDVAHQSKSGLKLFGSNGQVSNGWRGYEGHRFAL